MTSKDKVKHDGSKNWNLAHQTLDNTQSGQSDTSSCLDSSASSAVLTDLWVHWPNSKPHSLLCLCSGLTQMIRLSEQVPWSASGSKINPWFISLPINHIWLPRTSQSWLVTGLPAPARGQLSCGSAGLPHAANCRGTVGDHTWLIGRVLSLWIVSTNLQGKLTIKIKLITRWNQLGTFSCASLLLLQALSICTVEISHNKTLYIYDLISLTGEINEW